MLANRTASQMVYNSQHHHSALCPTNGTGITQDGCTPCALLVRTVTSPRLTAGNNEMVIWRSTMQACQRQDVHYFSSLCPNKGGQNKSPSTLVLLLSDWRGSRRRRKKILNVQCCWFIMLNCTSSIDTTFQAPVVWDKNRWRSELWEIERSALVICNIKYYHLNVSR